MYIALYSVRNNVKDWSLFSRQVALTNKSPLASLTILRYKYSRAGGGGAWVLISLYKQLPCNITSSLTHSIMKSFTFGVG